MENFFNKDLNESYDVIILGAGPAGCSAGKKLPWWKYGYN